MYFSPILVLLKVNESECCCVHSNSPQDDAGTKKVEKLSILTLGACGTANTMKSPSPMGFAMNASPNEICL